MLKRQEKSQSMGSCLHHLWQGWPFISWWAPMARVRHILTDAYRVSVHIQGL